MHTIIGDALVQTINSSEDDANITTLTKTRDGACSGQDIVTNITVIAGKDGVVGLQGPKGDTGAAGKLLHVSG